MLSLSEMILRLAVAALLGALVGLERELVGKEAGVRTNILVAGGAAIFAVIALSLPYLLSRSPEDVREIMSRNSGFLAIIANVVVGIGFLGAGIIVKENGHVRGLTTAASVWFVAALGILAGIGMIRFALVAAIGMVFFLIVLRKMNLHRLLQSEKIDEEEKKNYNERI